MATSIMSVSRSNRQDFDTTSIRSSAPSYTSEVPSYHTTDFYPEPIPPYSPPVRTRTSSRPAAPSPSDPPRRRTHQTIGLPPIPSAPPIIHNFRIPTWSTRNAPSSRQIRSVIERRVNNNNSSSIGADALSSSPSSSTSSTTTLNQAVLRPLEDPYLVGEQAAAQARRERVQRETGEDVLVREDRHWDYLLAQLKSWEQRETDWARFRRGVEATQRKKQLFRRIGARMI